MSACFDRLDASPITLDIAKLAVRDVAADYQRLVKKDDWGDLALIDPSTGEFLLLPIDIDVDTILAVPADAPTTAVLYGRTARKPTLLLVTLAGLVVYGLNRQGPLWIDITALIAIGFFIYGPIMIIGLHALDLVPKKAAGTAAGFTGFFGYVFGSAIAGTGVGWIADHWGWNGVFRAMIVCCVLTMIFSALTLRHRTTSCARPV